MCVVCCLLVVVCCLLFVVCCVLFVVNVDDDVDVVDAAVGVVVVAAAAAAAAAVVVVGGVCDSLRAGLRFIGLPIISYLEHSNNTPLTTADSALLNIKSFYLSLSLVSRQDK